MIAHCKRNVHQKFNGEWGKEWEMGNVEWEMNEEILTDFFD